MIMQILGKRKYVGYWIVIFPFICLFGMTCYASSAYWPAEGWRTATPEEQGMHSNILADMLEEIQIKSYSIDSITIIRNGFMVADAYFYPFSKGQKHIIHSCTKSIMSALIGIAIDKGYIKNVISKLHCVRIENCSNVKIQLIWDILSFKNCK